MMIHYITLMITNTSNSTESEAKLFSDLYFVQGVKEDGYIASEWGKTSLQATTCSWTGYHWGQIVGSIPAPGWCPLSVPVPWAGLQQVASITGPLNCEHFAFFDITSYFGFTKVHL